MNRRRFIEGSAAGLGALLTAGGFAADRSGREVRAGRIDADLAIVGGGLGGCAAALAALRAGRTVVLTEPTDWIGGQLTQQAVPPDEHPWIERFGRNRSYQELRDGIRFYYQKHYPLSIEAIADRSLNPGRGGVSALCCEPRVALAVLTAMLAPYASAGKLTVLLERVPVSAETDRDRVRSVDVRHARSGNRTTLVAPYFLDATELGDLLPLAGVEFVVGFESRTKTGEDRGPDQDRPLNQQAITYCFAIDYQKEGDFTIDKPAEYQFWRDYAPKMKPSWPGKLLDWTATDPQTLEPRRHAFNPEGAGDGLWVYRRIADPRTFRPGFLKGGMTLVNWPQNDFLLGPIIGPGVSAQDAERRLAQAKQLSLSLLYWMQTEAPRPDGGTGWKGLRLRPDVVGTEDGLAKHAYIRESRRIVAEFTVLDKHVGTESRRKATGRTDVVRGERFADSVGVGSYRIDLHPSTEGDNYIDISSLPFQIPLGALLPVRVENLLPACKNLGVTHITNGCYRLHPVEWAIGEASGLLASFCVERKVVPREVRSKPGLFADFHRMSVAHGVETDWPELRPR